MFNHINLITMMVNSGHTAAAIDGNAKALTAGRINTATYLTAVNVIKAANIKRMQGLNAKMQNAASKAERLNYCAMAQAIADDLHSLCGMTWADIEAVEFA